MLALLVALILSWTGSSDPVAGYKLHYGSASHSYQFHRDTGQATSTPAPTPTLGHTYYYAVTAYNQLGVESQYSNEINFTNSPPTPSPNPTPLPTSTPTPDPTPTETPTPSSLPTSSPTVSPTASPTPTDTPTPVPTESPSPTVTPTPSPSPTQIPSPTPFPTPQPAPSIYPFVAPPEVVAFALISNENGQVIRALNAGDVINLMALPTTNINVLAVVRADYGVGVSRVVFRLDLYPQEYETRPPYTLCGAYYPCNPGTLTGPGTHVLRALAYGGGGQMGPIYAVWFTIINE